MANSPSERPWLKALRLFRRPEAGRRSRTGRTTRRATVELLESRTLLASNWTALTNQPPIQTAVQTMELLTNGDVMAATYDNNFKDWYLLTPSSTGSYVNGTWSFLTSEPTGRLYYGSTIMQNGNLFIVGGEYINGSSTETWANTGEIYDPATNSWSSIPNFPQSEFGDDPVELLENGEILAGYLAGPQTYLYNITHNTWSETGTKQDNDPSDEEGWVKLPDDSILSYDVWFNTGKTPGHAQRYIPSTGKWVETGTVPVALSNTSEFEMGPTALLPNGDVIFIGAAQIASAGGDAETAIFNPTTDTNNGGGTWSAGPVVPGGYVADDAAGVLLPNGQFIFTADKPNFTVPTHVFDYNYQNNTITDITSSSNPPSELQSQLGSGGSYVDRFLMLPNGQALFTAGASTQLYVFTGTGSVNSSSTPSISGITNNGSNSYTLTGSALNGASQGATYGDDAQMDTNYPIVSVATNIGTTYFATTTNWNMTGVGTTDGATSVNFALPSAISSAPSVTADALTAAEGQALTNVTVATFTDPNGDFTGDYAATINWGDGNQTTGTISGPSGGVYTVTGTHTYTEEGSYTLSTTIVDNYASGQLSVAGSGVSSTPTTFNLSGAGSTTFTVSDPSVIGTGGFTITAVMGTLSTSQTVATFTDPGGDEPLSDYGASIAWGDGNTSAGVITGPNGSGVYTVTGSNTYAAAGSITIVVTLTHEASTSTIVDDTANVASAVTDVTSSTPNGTYGVGKTIVINVIFGSTETVTGTPELALNSGGTAFYTSGSGSNTLTFTYTVGAGDASSHLDYTTATALTLNGGTIDGPASIPAVLTLPAPGTAGSLGANSDIVIDTVAPTVVSYSVLFGKESYNLIGSSRYDLPWTITGIQVVFSKPIATADINSLTGLTSTAFAGLGTNTLTWTISPITIGLFATDLLGTGPNAIEDVAGNELYAGAGFAQNFKVLYGDFTGAGSVSSVDVTGILAAMGGPYNIFADLNGDGVVNITDAQIARSQIGKHL
jgi:hypothetical protein